MTDAARLAELSEQWRGDLASWAIPPAILEQAEEAPWSHPVAMFTVAADITDSPSHRMARAAVPATGSVLDVGAGGGRAAFAVTPPAGTVSRSVASPPRARQPALVRQYGDQFVAPR